MLTSPAGRSRRWDRMPSRCPSPFRVFGERQGRDNGSLFPRFPSMFKLRLAVPTRSLAATYPTVSRAARIPYRFQSTKAAMGVDLKGRCVCNSLKYAVTLDSADDARTTLCHCKSCRRAFGTNYGLTTKVRTPPDGGSSSRGRLNGRAGAHRLFQVRGGQTEAL